MNQGKILIVEDSRIVAEDIKQKLNAMGYEVSAVATSGEKALEAVGRDLPDIALMDIKLGEGMNGIDTAAELKRKYQVPVIYLTAYADHKTIERAKYTEPYGYIIKPFDDKELQSAIEIALFKHQMERKLRVSEEWLRMALTSIGDGVIATDMVGRVTFLNPVAESLTGWSQNEAEGQLLSVVFNIINEITRKPCENPVAKVIKTGRVVGLANHTLLISKDGREIPIKDSGSPILLNGKEKLGVILVFQDDTKARKAEEEIRESEEKYRALFQYNPIQTVTVDTECKITGYNFAKEKSGGRLPEIGGIMYKDYASGHQINMYAELKDCIASSEIKRFPKVKYHDKYLDVTISPFPMGAIISSIDITEKIQAQNALEESELKHRNILESMSDPVFICSEDSVVEYINPVMLKRIGYDATGQKCYRAIHGLDRKCAWCENHRAKEGRSWQSSLVSPLDGRDYQVTHSPIIQPGGRVSTLAVYRDMTDFIKIQNKLRQAQKMEAIGNLAGGVAHDFNNILSSIIGFTELALDDAKTGSSLEDNLQEVYTAGKRAKNLVRQILLFARQSTDEIKPVRIDLIVAEALKLIRSSIPSSIEIRQYLESKSSTMADATQIHQVVMNLCGNAADAIEDGGIIHIEVKDERIDENIAESHPDIKPGDYVKLTVSDNGCGISADIIDSIFEPYYTTKPTGQGTGMGLATVYGIVKQYGGEIILESDLNKGSTFNVYLPVAISGVRDNLYEPKELPTGSEKILFVDDEAPIAKMGGRNLEGLGYAVTTRTSSIEALELFRQQPDQFDLVVTDMTMPNMTGDKLAVELIKIRPDIPVILCTGYSRRVTDEKAADIGIKAFAYKPIVKADLAKTVRKVLDEAGKISPI